MPRSTTRCSGVMSGRAFHATTRSTEAEAVATHRAMAFARAADAPVYVVHLSCAAAMRHVADAKASGVRAYAETCPHYLTLTDERYDEPDPLTCARCLISPPLRPTADRDALWAGLADGRLDLVATDHVPDRLAVEKGDAAARRPVRQDLQRRARDRDAPRDGLRRRRRARPADDRADGRPARDDAGPAVRASSGRARSRSAATRTSSSSTRRPGGRSAPRTSTTRATTRRTRASRSRAPSARCSSAGGPSSATAPSSASEASAPSSSAAGSGTRP